MDDDPDPFEYFKQPWVCIAMVAIYAAGFMLGKSYMAKMLG